MTEEDKTHWYLAVPANIVVAIALIAIGHGLWLLGAWIARHL